MYASDHSKNAITAEEKIAELMKQRNGLLAQLSAEEILRKQEKDNYQCAMTAAMNVEKKLKGEIEDLKMDVAQIMDGYNTARATFEREKAAIISSHDVVVLAFRKVDKELEEVKNDYEEASRALSSTRLLAAKSMDEIRLAAGAPLSGDDKSLKRAVDYVRELKAENARLREALEKPLNIMFSLIAFADLYFERQGRDPYSNDNYCRAKDWCKLARAALAKGIETT
jgi:chromosome segregation ATPase